MNGGEGGDERENISREREKGFDTDEENSVVTRFVPNVTSFEMGGSEVSEGFKVADLEGELVGEDGLVD